ncbi:MAG TPA: zf-HC2 domain-containing protein [Acidimicrobiia bacterium]|jgi:anti-sigma factor (TIGR02949 family)
MSSSECDDALTNLYRYLDRETDVISAEQIRAHLDDCSGCLRSFDFESRLKVVIRERLSEDVPAEFIQRLRQAVARESTTPL